MDLDDDKLDALTALSDVPRQEVEERVEEEYERMKQHQSSEISKDQLIGFAFNNVKNDLANITGGSSGPRESDLETFPVLTMGYQEKEGDYFVTTDGYRALVGLGLSNPDEDPAGITTFVIDEADGVDIDYVKELFEPLNVIEAKVSRRNVGSFDNEPTIKKGGKPTYVCETGESSTFKEVDPTDPDAPDRVQDLPSDHEAKRKIINENFLADDETVTVQSYAEHLTAVNSGGGDRNFEVGFGADIKRIRGEVVDVFDNGDGFGLMTLMDSTVLMEEDVPEELISDRMRVPGLQVWNMPPELLKYGENSVLDVYGFIEQHHDSGHYRMSAFGAIPIIEFERDASNGSDDDVEEEVI